MPQSNAFEHDNFGCWYEGRHYTSVMHDNDSTWLDDSLNDHDGPDGVRNTTTSIMDHSRICRNWLEWTFLGVASIMILIAS